MKKTLLLLALLAAPLLAQGPRYNTALVQRTTGVTETYMDGAHTAGLSALRFNEVGGNNKWSLGVLGDSFATTNLQNAFYVYQYRDKAEALLNKYRLFIDNEGEVGIGTSTPDEQLHVYSAADAPIYTLTETTQSGRNAGYLMKNGAGDWGVYLTSDNGNLLFRDRTNSVTAMTIELGADANSIYVDANGDIGIGTASPEVKIDAQEDDGTAAIVQLRSNVNTQFKGYAYGGTEASKSATPDETPLVFLTGSGYGTSQQNGGHFSIRTDELWSASAEGTYATLFLTALGGTAPTQLFDWRGTGKFDLIGSTALLGLNPHDSPPTCNAGEKGSLYYDNSLSELCDCDGSSWAQVDGGGSC